MRSEKLDGVTCFDLTSEARSLMGESDMSLIELPLQSLCSLHLVLKYGALSSTTPY